MTHVQDERSGEEAEALAVADLLVIHSVSFADLEERVLPDTTGLAEVVVRREGAIDVALDGRLARRVLSTNTDND